MGPNIITLMNMWATCLIMYKCVTKQAHTKDTDNHTILLSEDWVGSAMTMLQLSGELNGKYSDFIFLCFNQTKIVQRF